MKSKVLLGVLLAVLITSLTTLQMVQAAPPPRATLTVTITSPPDGLVVSFGGQFTVAGSVSCQNGDAGTVESVVQYAPAGTTEFHDVDGTGLSILVGDQPQTQTLQEGQSYEVTWIVTGNPGVYEVRISSQARRVKAAASEPQTVTIESLTPPPDIETVDTSYQDATIGYGAASGSYIDTFTADGVYQILSEEKDQQGTKKPVDDLMKLGWIYEFQDMSPRTETLVGFLGHTDFLTDDTDTGFYLQAEVTGTWKTVFEITNTANDQVYMGHINDDQSSTLRLRVIDNDQTPGNKVTSALYVDQLYIFEPTSMSNIEILTGSPCLHFNLHAWENLDDNWYHYQTHPTLEHEWGMIRDIVIADIDGDFEYETIVGSSQSSIEIYEYQNDALVLSHSFIHPGADGNQIRAIVAADLDNDHDPHLELLVSSSNFDIQSTIFKYIDGTYQPIFNIASDDPRNVGGAACAAGDVDNDGDIEFVVTEEFIDTDGLCLLRLFDWTGATWINVASYNFAVDHPLNWIFQTQIIDVDNDGTNEIFVNPEREPIQILKYENGALVSAWTAPVHSQHMEAARAGDINHDGLVDFVVADHDLDLVYIFENVGGTFVNTYNISVPGLQYGDDNSIAIGDIDGDGWNEFVHVSSGDHFLRIFRYNQLLFTLYLQAGHDHLGLEGAFAVAIGDYDNDNSG